MEYESVTQKVSFGNVVLADSMASRSPDSTPPDFFLWGYVKGTVYKIPVTFLRGLKLRTVASIETVTPQMLENTWRQIEYRLDILRAMKGAHIKVVWHSAVLILQIINLSELHFHIRYAVLSCFLQFENYWPRKPRQ
jgi:hypothetical protein